MLCPRIAIVNTAAICNFARSGEVCGQPDAEPHAFAAPITVIGSRLSTTLPVGFAGRTLVVGVADLLVGLTGAALGHIVLLVVLLGFLDAFLLAGLLFGGHGRAALGIEGNVASAA